MKASATGVQDVRIPPLGLRADLSVPPRARGIVVFAHGSGSSRLSPRNRFVADVLVRHGLATLLFDLLTRDEDRDYELRFDIPLLADRLEEAVRWAAADRRTSALGLGLFGASTGAAAALQVAAEEPRVRAVVSRGGRPDLAFESLGRVLAPTLLIVGGEDDVVLELNHRAFDHLALLEPEKKSLLVVPGATHLFEEPGALDAVALAAAEWFGRMLVGAEPDLAARA